MPKTGAFVLACFVVFITSFLLLAYPNKLPYDYPEIDYYGSPGRGDSPGCCGNRREFSGNPEQYDFLRQCLNSGDLGPWNE